MDLVSHADLARLHPTDALHPERPERMVALHECFGFRETREATDAELLRCHEPAYVERIRTLREARHLDADTWGSETTSRAARLAAGAAVEAALTGSRDAARHAAMLDPHTAAELPLDEIAALMDELLECHDGRHDLFAR